MRLSQGLSIIHPYLQRRTHVLPKRDFISMISSHSTEIGGLTKETQKKLSTLGNGSQFTRDIQLL